MRSCEKLKHWITRHLSSKRKSQWWVGGSFYEETQKWFRWQSLIYTFDKQRQDPAPGTANDSRLLLGIKRNPTDTMYLQHCHSKRSQFLIQNATLWLNLQTEIHLCSITGVCNLRPAWTFDMVRIRIFVALFRVQNHAKAKLHDNQVAYIW